MLTDTHCHIHESDYPLDRIEALQRAHGAGVGVVICVGTSERSSQAAIEFANLHEGVFASVGVHPHDTKHGWGKIKTLVFGLDTLASATFAWRTAEQNNTTSIRKIIAVGEIGLDYFYTHSLREVQIKALEEQIELALKYSLPIIFHVREAFDDFWPVFDNFQGIRGELHSFTGTTANLEEGLSRGLYIGMNGISTFTKDKHQQAMFASIPLEKLLLETDAPYLTPTPFRGRVNEPAFVRNVVEHYAQVRGLSFREIATATTANAHALFAFR